MADTALTPNTGALNLSFRNPRLTPLVGALLAVGVAATVIAGTHTTRTPSAGSLTATGQSAVIQQQGIITPGTGSLTASGVAPVVGSDRVLTLSAGALTAEGVAPSITLGTATVITPLTGDLSLARRLDVAVMPATGAVVGAGAAPGLHFDALQPGTGNLSLTGHAPLAGLGGGVIITPGTGIIFFGEGVASQPLTGALGFTGQQPTRITDAIRTPGTGALALVGTQPLSPGILITPSTGALDATGTTPGRSNSLTPGTGALAVVGVFPQLGGSVQVQPDAGALEAVGIASALKISGVAITPDTGALVATGVAGDLITDVRRETGSGALVLEGVAASISGMVITPGTGGILAEEMYPDLFIETYLTPSTASLIAVGQSVVTDALPPRGGYRFHTPRGRGRGHFRAPERTEG